MKKMVFMVTGWLFLALIGLEGTPLIKVPTTKLIWQTRTLKPLINTTPIPTNCPPLFIYNNTIRKCYYLVDSKMSFTAGNTTCVGYGASLVMPKSEDELVFVAQLIPLEGYNTAWLGVTYRTINGTSDFYYLDGTPFTSCTWGLVTPFETYPVLAMQKSDHCSSNWGPGGSRYIICESAPFQK